MIFKIITYCCLAFLTVSSVFSQDMIKAELEKKEKSLLSEKIDKFQITDVSQGEVAALVKSFLATKEKGGAYSVIWVAKNGVETADLNFNGGTIDELFNILSQKFHVNIVLTDVGIYFYDGQVPEKVIQKKDGKKIYKIWKMKK